MEREEDDAGWTHASQGPMGCSRSLATSVFGCLGGSNFIVRWSVESLLPVAGLGEQYVRVRRSGLLVFIVATSCSSPTVMEKHVEPLFRQVLLPQACSSDESIREACLAFLSFFLSFFPFAADRLAHT